MNLKKILSKIVIISLTIAIVLIPKVSTIIAIEPEVYIDSQGNIIERVYKDEESFRLIGTHAFSEYTKKTADMGVADLDKLKSLADKANKSGSKSTLYSYASFITSFFWPSVSTSLSVASMMPTSTIKPYETVSYCYDRVSYLYKNPKYTKARGEIKYTRFWNGYSYSCPWQPFRAPRHICYVK